MEREPPVLSLRRVSKHFGGVQALTDADLDVRRGEVVALVGDNAAGKSTLARIVAGALQPSSGTIQLDGVEVTIPSTQAAFSLGIATVFQGVGLPENLDVVSSIFLGREMSVRFLLDTERMSRLARAYLNQLNARIPDLSVRLRSLTAGQRQCVAIARTLIARPRLVVLDEPTASLSVDQTAEVLSYVDRLRGLGLGVILTSPNLNDVRAVADRIEVLRHGRNNGSFIADSSTYEEILSAITGAVRFPRPHQ